MILLPSGPAKSIGLFECESPLLQQVSYFLENKIYQGITFPILEATSWNESDWYRNEESGRIQRNLLYDIDPNTAFIQTSHVNETQVRNSLDNDIIHS